MTAAQTKKDFLKAFSEIFQSEGFKKAKGKGKHILSKDVGAATLGQMAFLQIKRTNPSVEFYTTFRHHQVEALANQVMADHPDKFSFEGFTFHFPSHIFFKPEGERKRVHTYTPYLLTESSPISAVLAQYHTLYCQEIAPFLIRNIELETLDKTLNTDLSGEIPYSGQIDIRAIRGLVVRKLLAPASVPDLADAYRPLLTHYTEDAQEFFEIFVRELLKATP